MTFGLDKITANMLTISSEKGVLMTINLETGKVWASSLEAASEAGRVFVASVRKELDTDKLPEWYLEH